MPTLTLDQVEALQVALDAIADRVEDYGDCRADEYTAEEWEEVQATLAQDRKAHATIRAMLLDNPKE